MGTLKDEEENGRKIKRKIREIDKELTLKMSGKFFTHSLNIQTPQVKCKETRTRRKLINWDIHSILVEVQLF